MSTSPETARVPSIDQLSSEVIATLLYAARAYLDPQYESESALSDAEIAIDIAAEAIRRSGDRLAQGEQSVLASMLAETRIECVRRRSL